MTERVRPSSDGKPRGIRFPDAEHRRYALMARESQRTFQDMVLYLCRRGAQAVEQDERDRQAGAAARRVRK